MFCLVSRFTIGAFPTRTFNNCSFQLEFSEISNVLKFNQYFLNFVFSFDVHYFLLLRSSESNSSRSSGGGGGGDGGGGGSQDETWTAWWRRLTLPVRLRYVLYKKRIEVFFGFHAKLTDEERERHLPKPGKPTIRSFLKCICFLYGWQQPEVCGEGGDGVAIKYKSKTDGDRWMVRKIPWEHDWLKQGLLVQLPWKSKLFKGRESGFYVPTPIC